MNIQATSPDGLWRFQEGKIFSQDVVITPFALDFLERWTFAKFLRADQLALAFETGQPWSEFGSYGSPLWGIQVLTHTRQSDSWELRALEYDCREKKESFIPQDICWHPHGVLAWLCYDELYLQTELYLQVLQSPRQDIPGWQALPPTDSMDNLDFTYSTHGDWTAVSIGSEGYQLIAIDDTGYDTFDLKWRLRQRKQAQHWEPLEWRGCLNV